jgi:hypothetical protein
MFALAGFGWSRHLADEGLVVAGNVHLAGEPLQGMGPDQVASAVSARANDLLTRELTIEYGPGELAVPFGDLGFTYDETATAGRAMTARHEGAVWEQFSSWAVSGLAVEEIDEVWSFDVEEARDSVDDHPGLTPLVYQEPQIAAQGSDGLVMSPGVVGSEADIDDIVEQLAGIELDDAPDRLATAVEEIHPTVSDDQAQVATDRLNEVTGNGVQVSVGGRSAVITRRVLQDLLEIEIGNGEVAASFDGQELQGTLERMFVGPVGPFTEPELVVNDESIEVVTQGEPPPVCCRADLGQWIGEEILAGNTGPFLMLSRPADDPSLVAWADGSQIVEKVGEFTTPHACCEARVSNIQRMADIVRGVYLVPGERFSLNEFVGPRTTANGFVAAGAIRQGHLISEIGGGVSQFATTIFNAAYFAGMDFEEYRSHTIYFSRYPYGREATISNPAPDLIMVNTTEYPILIWTSYTGESITVSMYSTKHIEIAELDQRTSRRGVCTHVETDRERTYPDGSVVVDTFIADYRPAEGIDCNGNRIPPPA